MASKPIESPRSGPSSDKNHVKEGSEVPEVVNKRIRIKFVP